MSREGSVVTLDFVDGATTIALNGSREATIPGEAFNEALTRVWLGEQAGAGRPEEGDAREAPAS